MKFKSLSNKEVRLEIVPAHYPVRTRAQSKSAGQYNLGRQIQKIYSVNALLLEEFAIPDERLFLDFYLPHHNLAFEFHGAQHDSFHKFFHTDKQGFEKSVARDDRKRAWCTLNSITLVEVRAENISAEDLQKLIQEALDD